MGCHGRKNPGAVSEFDLKHPWTALKDWLRPVWYRQVKDRIFRWRFARERARLLRAGGTGDPGRARTFVYLCVRRPVYVDLAIDSINSLHARNRHHQVRVHGDEVCARRWALRSRRLDYPELVTFDNRYENRTEEPWQWLKADTLEEACRLGAAFIDADSFWHSDPEWDLRRACLLAPVNRIGEKPAEASIALWLTGRPESADWGHDNVGFVYLPQELSRGEFFPRLKDWTRKISAWPGDPAVPEVSWGAARRTSEELALSLLLRDWYQGTAPALLKAVDGPRNQHIVESFYYGALHGVD